MNRSLFWAAAALCGLATAAPVRADAEKELRIGLLAELSGTFAASAGLPCREGYETARRLYAPGDRAGGVRLKFIYGDTRGDARTAMAEFQKLLDVDRVQAVITNRTQVCMTLSPAAARRRFPLVGVCGGSRVLETSPFTFQFYSNAADEALALARRITEAGYRRAAIISLQDEWFVSMRDNFRADFEKRGGRIVLDQEFPEDLLNFSSAAAALRGAAPEAIVVNVGPTQTGPLVRQLRVQGLKQPLFGNFYTRSAEAIENAGAEAMEGLTAVELDTAKPRFAARHAELFPGSEVNPLTYACFAGAAFLLQAVAQSGAASQAEIFSALSAVSYVELPDERLPVRDRRAIYGVGFRVIRNGKVLRAPQ